MGEKSISNKLELNIINVDDLETNVTFLNETVHEGNSLDALIGIASASGDSSITFSLIGENSSDFSINENGEIKVAKNLDFEKIQTYDLKIQAKGRFDTVESPLLIKLAKNINPDFSVNCVASCSLAEDASIGTTIINTLRNDSDTDDLIYSLENNHGNKFSINQKTGTVELTSPLDYETTSSYDLKVVATDSKKESPRKDPLH